VSAPRFAGVLLACALPCCADEPTAPRPVEVNTLPADSKPIVPPPAEIRPSSEGVRSWPSPAPSGSVLGDLHRTPGGQLVLSWVEPTPERDRGGALKFARWSLDAGRWGPTTEAVADPEMLVNWADFPRVFSFGPDGRAWIATWPRATGEHAYTTMIRTSSDDAAHFGPARTLPEIQDGPEFGFPSFARTPEGARVFWLDGRATAPHGEAHEDAEPGGAMQLRAATVRLDGSIVDRQVLDRRVCDCCQTSAGSGARGPMVAFRDRGPTEIRDLAVLGWQREGRLTVHDDEWTIAGCPVNGPALAPDEDGGDGLAVVWFTAATPPGVVNLAFADGGRSFTRPVRLDLGHPLGRVDALRFGEHAVATWLEADPDGDGAMVLLRAASAERAQGEVHRIATVSAGRDSGFPRLAALGDELIVSYTTDAVRLAAFSP
jgi:hypothetical protein